jgi:hypothetical protein
MLDCIALFGVNEDGSGIVLVANDNSNDTNSASGISVDNDVKIIRIPHKQK